MKYSNASYLYRLLLFIVFISNSKYAANAQDPLINYDEAKIPPYTLPDPMRLPNGKRITTKEEWQKQRPAMLQLFADNVYGRLPGKPTDMHFVVTSIDSSALGGKAIRKQITIFFTRASAEPSMEVLLYLPSNSKTPVPVFMGLNFNGNQTVSNDPHINISARWVRNDEQKHIAHNRATEASRGSDAGKWQVEE